MFVGEFKDSDFLRSRSISSTVDGEDDRDSERSNSPVGEFTRQGSLRNSKRGLLANRLKSIEERGDHDSLKRASTDSEDLMDFLLQGDEDGPFFGDRQSSIRRRRNNNKNLLDRERAISPQVIDPDINSLNNKPDNGNTNNKTENDTEHNSIYSSDRKPSLTNCPVVPSPLVLSEGRCRSSIASISSQSSDDGPVEDPIANMRNKRLADRRRKKAEKLEQHKAMGRDVLSTGLDNALDTTLNKPSYEHHNGPTNGYNFINSPTVNGYMENGVASDNSTDSLRITSVSDRNPVSERESVERDTGSSVLNNRPFIGRSKALSTSMGDFDRSSVSDISPIAERVSSERDTVSSVFENRPYLGRHASSLANNTTETDQTKDNSSSNGFDRSSRHRLSFRQRSSRSASLGDTGSLTNHVETKPASDTESSTEPLKYVPVARRKSRDNTAARDYLKMRKEAAMKTVTDVDKVIKQIEKTGEEIQQMGVADEKPPVSQSINRQITNRWGSSIDHNAERDLDQNKDNLMLNTAEIKSESHDQFPVAPSRSRRGMPSVSSLSSIQTPPVTVNNVTTTHLTRPMMQRSLSETPASSSSSSDPLYAKLAALRQRMDSSYKDSASQKAWINHSAGDWKSNVEQEDVHVALEKHLNEERPTSAYDNVDGHVKQENDGNRRWGKYYNESGQEPSSFSRTDNRRWSLMPQTPHTDNIGEFKNNPENEDFSQNSLDRSALRRTRSMRDRFKSLPADGLISSSLRSRQHQDLDNNVQTVRPVTSGIGKRLNAKFTYYQDDQGDTWNTVKVEPAVSAIPEETNTILSPRSSRSDDSMPVSPRDSRILEDGTHVKSDGESSSSRDDGFESSSDPPGSQRTSMSSTLEQELNGTPTMGREKYSTQSIDDLSEADTTAHRFARSIDSLVQKHELASGGEINIDDDPTTTSSGDDKKLTTTPEETMEMTWTEESSVKDLPPELHKALMGNKQTENPPAPPMRTTSKTSTPASPTKQKKTTSPVKKADTRKVTPPKNNTTPLTKPVKPKTTTPTGASVFSRLSRPKNPALSRNASNSSLASDTSTGSGRSTSRLDKTKTAKSSPSSSGRTTPKNIAASPSPRPSSATPTSTTRTRQASSKPPTPTSTSLDSEGPKTFVRGGAGRLTMPADVLRTNKKAAAESNKGVPAPPRRSSSIRVGTRLGTDKVSPKPETSIMEENSSSPATPETTSAFRKNSTSDASPSPRPNSKLNRLVDRLSTPKNTAPRASPKSPETPRTPRSGENPRSRKSSVSSRDGDGENSLMPKRSPSFLKKLMDKSPGRKTPGKAESPMTPRRSRLSLGTTTKSSVC